MISPTPRAIFLMLLGVPLMVLIALVRPELWIVSAGWICLVLSAMPVSLPSIRRPFRNTATYLTIPVH